MVALIVGVAAFGAILYSPTASSFSAQVAFSGLFSNQNSTTVTFRFGVIETGGRLPVIYTVYWSDGYNESSSHGCLHEISFLGNGSIPEFVLVLVTGSDRKTVVLVVNIPRPTASSTDFSSAISSNASLED